MAPASIIKIAVLSIEFTHKTAKATITKLVPDIFSNTLI